MLILLLRRSDYFFHPAAVIRLCMVWQISLVHQVDVWSITDNQSMFSRSPKPLHWHDKPQFTRGASHVYELHNYTCNNVLMQNSIQKFRNLMLIGDVLCFYYAFIIIKRLSSLWHANLCRSFVISWWDFLVHASSWQNEGSSRQRDSKVKHEILTQHCVFWWILHKPNWSLGPLSRELIQCCSVFRCFYGECATFLLKLSDYKMEFGTERKYLSSALLPGMKRLVRSVHSLLGLSRATVCHPGYLLPSGRVQHREHRGCGDPAAVHVALRPQQRSGDIQAVVSVHGGGQAGEDLPEEAASPQHTESGHAGAECVCGTLTVCWRKVVCPCSSVTDCQTSSSFPSVSTGPEETARITWPRTEHNRRGLQGPLLLHSADAFNVQHITGQDKSLIQSSQRNKRKSKSWCAGFKMMYDK